MEIAAIIGMVNALTGVITQLLVTAKATGVDVDALLAKYDAAQEAVQAYTPLQPPPQS